MTLKLFQSICEENGLSLSPDQLSKIDLYAKLIKEWNAKINLISRKDEENLLAKHILHSLTLLIPNISDVIPRGSKLLDLGTGGGFPGIPIGIVRPDLQITLCDSIQKKIGACENMIKRLGLTNIRTVVGRAEEFKKDSHFRNQF